MRPVPLSSVTALLLKLEHISGAEARLPGAMLELEQYRFDPVHEGDFDVLRIIIDQQCRSPRDLDAPAVCDNARECTVS